MYRLAGAKREGTVIGASEHKCMETLPREHSV